MLHSFCLQWLQSIKLVLCVLVPWTSLARAFLLPRLVTANVIMLPVHHQFISDAEWFVLKSE